ncbi:class I SAM-dependent methyltransferase [Prodigiosinella aquatilis]|nr:class I SAM-dependent methyltransferase [Prodigiosinella sp. LS101]WJV53693.1 class I SAM-dependent methyltransferase [Prodigiosinella sp. LS101]WJV58052.1 class I SAM-dependent methyltransferase [Pectobacteriaceae bacterium C111]
MNTNWTEKQTSELFDAYDDWVEDHFGYQPMIADLTNSCGKEINVLDYGCGGGKVSRRLETAGIDHVTGVDIAPTMIDKAKAAGGDKLQYVHIPGPMLPFSDGSFDAAISCFLFINIPERLELSRVTSEVARLLKPGGIYYVLDTNPRTTGIQYPTYRNGEYGVTYHDGEDRPVYLNIPGQQSLKLVDKNWDVQTYHQTFAQAGLTLIEEKELKYVNNFDNPDRQNFNELQDTKPFIMFKTVKASG